MLEADRPIELSTSRFAALLADRGVTEVAPSAETIRTYCNQGMPCETRDTSRGKRYVIVDPDAAIEWMKANDKLASSHGGRRLGAGRKSATPKAEAVEEDDSAPKAKTGTTAAAVTAGANARHKNLQSQILEMQLRTRLGELVELVDVREGVTRVYRAFAEVLDRLPRKAADEIAAACSLGEKDRVAVEETIRKMLDAARTELAADPLEGVAGVDLGDDTDG